MIGIAIRMVPRSESRPRAASSASSISAKISRARSRNSAPASVTVMRRVVRNSSLTPSRASSSPMMRETEGCDSDSSRAAREKLPLSAARTKTCNSCSRSLICISNKCCPYLPYTHSLANEPDIACQSTQGVSQMTLQDRLDAFKADFVGGKLSFKPTKERLELMARATSELIESGQAQRAKKAGDIAPEFTLNDPEGNPVSSRDLLAKGPLVVSFYRGVWCPYCNLELQALQAALADIAARRANLIAISPQTMANSRKSQRDNRLDFPILSDVKSEVANAFGIRFALPDYLAEVYKSFGNNLPVVNDDPAWVLPMPARYVIATSGIIAYSEVNPDYTQRPDPSELLPVLDRLRASKAA